MVGGTARSDGNAPKAVFFDIRDTLGIVDRQGHLVTYKPTTERLLDAMRRLVGLRIGLITNLPDNVSDTDGLKMVAEAGIASVLDPEGFVSNHAAGAEKPSRGIYEFAAHKMGLDPAECVFVGENLIEVIGAEAAGMRTVLKPFPPGREFLLKPTAPGSVDAVSSGRLSELILEEDHLIAKRVVGAGVTLLARLRALTDPVAQIGGFRRPMGLLVWLTQNFIDPFHHAKEERVLFPFGIMRGLDPSLIDATVVDHEQGRAYFRGLAAAYRRLLHRAEAGTISEFTSLLSGFIELYKAHGKYEDDVVFKQLGDLLTADDDAVLVDLIERVGPPDITLYLNLISGLERDLAS